MSYAWCEYYRYKPNDNLEMVFNFRAKNYIKKYIRENQRCYGKNYTQELLVINEELQNIKKDLFGK